MKIKPIAAAISLILTLACSAGEITYTNPLWDGSIVGAAFIEAETTFAHLAHVRNIFLTHGLPNDFYTDGLSLFGHESRKAGDTVTRSQFQRALGCLSVSHDRGTCLLLKEHDRGTCLLLKENPRNFSSAWVVLLHEKGTMAG